MVEILEQNEKLYMEKNGKEIQISSATIKHYLTMNMYVITVYPKIGKKQEYTQKKYPLIGIQLKNTKHPHGEYKSYYNKSEPNYYINYYTL